MSAHSNVFIPYVDMEDTSTPFYQLICNGGDSFTLPEGMSLTDFFGTVRVGNRAELEVSDTKAHFSTYTVFFRELGPEFDGEMQHEFFTYRRMKKGGEPALHSMVSIGIGGHTDLPSSYTTVDEVLSDDIAAETIGDAIAREICEEIKVYPTDFPAELTVETDKVILRHLANTALFMYLPDDEVSSRHIAVVRFAKIEPGCDILISSAERGISKAIGWLTDDMMGFSSNVSSIRLENWSNHIVSIFDHLKETKPSLFKTPQEQMKEISE